MTRDGAGGGGEEIVPALTPAAISCASLRAMSLDKPAHHDVRVENKPRSHMFCKAFLAHFDERLFDLVLNLRR